MDTPTREMHEHNMTELANFCFAKLAKLEARFVILCDRASRAGIDCTDLISESFTQQAEPEPVRLVN